MSLINDALKRAKKSQTAPAKPGEGTPMHAADSHQSVGLPSYFIPVLLCVFCGAFWFIVRGWEARRQSEFYGASVKVHAREGTPESGATSLPGTDPGSLGAEDSQNLIPENRNFSLNDEPSAAASTAAPSASAPIEPSAAAEAPTYRLQGIFYRPSGPSAVVNTKTVYIGDTISGGRVKGIDRNSVTIERNGELQVLTLQ